MSFVWFVCTVFENDNECLADASLIEYAYGFRGAAILVLLFSVFINIELTYTGEVKGRYNNIVRNNNNNNGGSTQAGVGLVVAPVQQVTTTNDDEDEDGNNETNDNNDPEVQEPVADEQDTIVR